MDKKALIALINKALADEWLSYYRYWVGAKVIVGKMKEQVATELEEIATAELKHAGLLVDKIIKLGGTPILKPNDWCKTANCVYDVPKAFSIKAVLFQNIKSEQCTIDAYKKLVNITKRKKPTISELLKSILEEEIEHKDDLINMAEHMEIAKS